MNAFLGKILLSMPNIEKRRKSFLFRTLAPYLELVPENDFHWLFYAVTRMAFLVSAVPGFFAAIKLSLVETLTPDIVNSALREMSLVNAALLLFLVVPYHVFKTTKVVGFSRIDYKRAFARSTRIKMPDWWHDREKLLRRVMFLIFVVSVTIVFSWISLDVFLEHFHVMLNIYWLCIFILLSCFFCSLSCAI